MFQHTALPTSYRFQFLLILPNFEVITCNYPTSVKIHYLEMPHSHPGWLNSAVSANAVMRIRLRSRLYMELAILVNAVAETLLVSTT